MKKNRKSLLLTSLAEQYDKLGEQSLDLFFKERPFLEGGEKVCKDFSKERQSLEKRKKIVLDQIQRVLSSDSKGNMEE